MFLKVRFKTIGSGVEDHISTDLKLKEWLTFVRGKEEDDDGARGVVFKVFPSEP